MSAKDYRCRWCGCIVVTQEFSAHTFDDRKADRELFEHMYITCELGKLRDHIATQALNALLINPANTHPTSEGAAKSVVEAAYDYANLMMKERLWR